MQDEQIKLYDVVALMEPLLQEKLRRGQVGTIIEEWAPGVFEVEFSDTSGIPYAMVTLKAEQLMVLHHKLADAE